MVVSAITSSAIVLEEIGRFIQELSWSQQHILSYDLFCTQLSHELKQNDVVHYFCRKEKNQCQSD